MLDEEAQRGAIRFRHIVKGQAHALNGGIVGQALPQALVGLLGDQRGRELPEELLVQAGQRMDVVRVQPARIVEVRQLATQLVHQHLVPRGAIQAVLFDALRLLDVGADIDHEARHIGMIGHVQLQGIEGSGKQGILLLLVQVQAIHLATATAGLFLALWRAVAARGEEGD